MEIETLANNSVFSSGPSANILWFEYLLDPALLEKQLKRENSGILATDLIIEFLINSHNVSATDKNGTKVIDVDNPENLTVLEPRTRKSLALQILALKCAAHLNWNFQLFENRVPLTLQQLLYQDLLYFVDCGKIDSRSHTTINYADASPQLIFAVSTYHRWVLWALRSAQVITRPNKVIHIPMPGGQGPTYVPPHIVDALINQLKLQANDSVIILENILKTLGDKKLTMPTIETFVSLTENSMNEVEHRWEEGYSVSRDEFELQLRYDLAVWFMFANHYTSAKHHLQFVAKLFATCSPRMEFCSIAEATLRGFLSACQVENVNGEKSLTERMHEAIKKEYSGFLNVLREDNVHREVPIHYREMAELDLLCVATTGKAAFTRDFIFKVKTLNVIRRALDDRHIPRSYFLELSDEGPTGLSYLIGALEEVYPNDSDIDRIKVKELLLRINMSGGDVFTKKEFAKSPLKDLLQGETIKEPRPIECQPFVTDFPRTLWPEIECGELIQQLIESYRPSEIEALLERLSRGWPNRPFYNLYKKWEIPIPFQGVVMNLPKGMLLDWSYIMLAKSRELLSLGDYVGAIEMLQAMEDRGRLKQVGNTQAGAKLFKLIEWEVLLVQIMQFLSQWPKSSTTGRFAELVLQSRSCLGALQRGEAIFPRSEVVDHCVGLLLSACEWEFLFSLDVRWNLNNNVELAASLAAVCYDLQRDRDRPARKSSKTLWDTIVPTFNPSSATNIASGQGGGAGIKRTSSGAIQPGGSRDSPNANIALVTKATLSKFCQMLYEPQSLAVMLSLLVRLHNLIQDEANLDINNDLLTLWPNVLSNTNSYSLPSISETLSLLLERATSLYPLNTTWLKMQGDLHFSQGFHSAAMSCYLTAGSLASDYFHQNIPKHVYDEPTIRRMIKCSHSTSSFTHAAILCQFLDEVDYATAFRCLQERNCNDAMDSLYQFMWDVTMLEFIIQLHHKRGETQRKAVALKAIGVLELNANNNEEILREATAVRKSQFLRCLAKQYL